MVTEALMERVRRWLEERTQEDETAATITNVAFVDFIEWSKNQSDHQDVKAKDWDSAIRIFGIRKCRRPANYWVFKGFALKDDEEPEAIDLDGDEDDSEKEGGTQ